MSALLQQELDGTLPPLLLFWGHTAKADHPGPWVLSQWWPVKVEVDGHVYRHAEGWMMAEKARLFGDDETRRRILEAEHPGEAKKLGRTVKRFDHDAWMAVAYDIVVRGNHAKFTQHDDLRRYLVGTAPRVLVEASPRDRHLGDRLGAERPRSAAPEPMAGHQPPRLRAHRGAGDVRQGRLTTVAPPVPPRRRLWWALRRRCPRCGSKNVFKTYFTLHERCPRCGYRFEREEGFFTGVYLVNYSFTAALLFALVMGYTLWATVLGGNGPLAPVIVSGLVIAVVLPIVAYPVAKTLWAAIDLLMRPLEPVEEAEALLHADPSTHGDGSG